MERRNWWIEIPSVHSLFNFKWQPVSYGIKFERLSHQKGVIKDDRAPFTGGGASSAQFSSFSTASTAAESTSNIKQLVNHVECHHVISEKSNLYNLMYKYCDSNKESVFDYTPITFYVEVPDIEK